jgi:hypothetical protein
MCNKHKRGNVHMIHTFDAYASRAKVLAHLWVISVSFVELCCVSSTSKDVNYVNEPCQYCIKQNEDSDEVNAQSLYPRGMHASGGANDQEML